MSFCAGRCAWRVPASGVPARAGELPHRSCCLPAGRLPGTCARTRVEGTHWARVHTGVAEGTEERALVPCRLTGPALLKRAGALPVGRADGAVQARSAIRRGLRPPVAGHACSQAEAESLRVPADLHRRPPVLRHPQPPFHRRQTRSRPLRRPRHAHRRPALDARPARCVDGGAGGRSGQASR